MTKLILSTFILVTSLTTLAAPEVPGGLPERLECRLSSVAPRGNGASFRRSITIEYKKFDTTLPRTQLQPEFLILPNQYGLFFKGEDQHGVTLEPFYKNQSLLVMKTDAGYKIVVSESRGGGTGYGTSSFTVKSNYKCVAQ